MTAPIRVQLRRTKGWRMPPDTVKVDRTTPFGNPFDWCDCRDEFGISEDEARQSAVAYFRQYAAGELDLEGFTDASVAMDDLAKLLSLLPALRGKNLACWCPPGAPCHADVLLELANRP